MPNIKEIKIIYYRYVDGQNRFAIIRYKSGRKRVYPAREMPRTAKKWIAKNTMLIDVYDDGGIHMTTYKKED